MDAGRPLLLVVGGGLALLAALSGMRAERGPEVTTPVRATADVSVVQAGTTTTVETSLSYDGRPRTFVLHVPDGLLAPAPLVVALHARAQTAQSIRDYSDLEALADREGFIVAFPSGGGGSWNAGTCCRPGSELGTDDVTFLDEVIRKARDLADVDPDRIGLTGSSNGAMMALRYACERSGEVASVVAVAGPLVAPCTPSDEVAVLALHGGKDAVVPLAGGPNTSLGVTFPAVDASLQPLRAAGGDVELSISPNAGHGWQTVATGGVEATQVVWDWVRDHPRPRPR